MRRTCGCRHGGRILNKGWARACLLAVATACADNRLAGADPQVLTGSAATESAFRRLASTRRVLHLAADLVVLSACQTGLGSRALADVPAGDDWGGLTRAFLHAGARRVMATLWPVDDWATAALMERFYGAGDVAAEPVGALAEAQRALIAVPATAHPFYWAGFVSVGGSE